MENGQEIAAGGIHYHSTSRQHYHADIGNYISSGISAHDGNGNLVAAVEDISRNHEWVEELVFRLNRGQADPVHLHNIIFDAVFDAASG